MKKKMKKMLLLGLMMMLMTTSVSAQSRLTPVSATYKAKNPPNEPMLNALVDDPKRGDEQDFVYITNEQGKRVRRLYADRDYQLHIFYHAVASDKATQQQVEDARLLLRNYPSGLMAKQDKRTITAILSWKSNNQGYYRECNHNVIAKEDLICNLGLDSYNKANAPTFNSVGPINGKTTSFSEICGLVDTFLIGYNSQDGIVPCGEEYASEVIVAFTTARPKTAIAAGLRAESAKKPSTSTNNISASKSTNSENSTASSNEVSTTITSTSTSNNENFPLIPAISSNEIRVVMVDDNAAKDNNPFGNIMIVAIVSIGAIILIFMSMKVFSEQRRIAQTIDQLTSSQAKYTAYQQSVRDAADTIVIEALNTATKTYYDSGEVNFWDIVHRHIRAALNRIAQPDDLALPQIFDGCRICFNNERKPDQGVTAVQNKANGEAEIQKNGVKKSMANVESKNNTALQESSTKNSPASKSTAKGSEGSNTNTQPNPKTKDDTRANGSNDKKQPQPSAQTPEKQVLHLPKNIDQYSPKELEEYIIAADLKGDSPYLQELEKIAQKRLRAFKEANPKSLTEKETAEISELAELMDMIKNLQQKAENKPPTTPTTPTINHPKTKASIERKKFQHQIREEALEQARKRSTS